MPNDKISIKALLLDIDGVIKQKGKIIPNISDHLKRVIDNGILVKFVTNCSLYKLYKFSEKILPGYKVEIIDPLDVLKDLISKNPSLINHQSIILGTKDIKKRISELGIKLSDNKKVDSVFIFEKLRYNQDEITQASRAVLNGAKLYCAGIDQLFWFKGEAYPGVGAITEQIKFMTRANAFVLGKPSERIFELAMYPDIKPNQTAFVGDEFHIDILGAKKCGLTTVYLTTNSLANKPYYSNKVILEPNLKSFVRNFL